MTDSLFLRPDVHAAFVDRDLVLLDVAADRYLCLAAAADAAALVATRDRLVVRDPGLALDLQAAGLVCADEPVGSPRCALPPRAGRSALCDDYPAPAPADLADGLASLLDVVRRYHRRPLADILAAERPTPCASPPFTPAVAVAVTRFHTWAPFAPVSGKCLLRAFMLRRHLRRRGLDALWVFGVRTWPFHAHCWLQCEDVVLDDPAERIAAFTPLLAL